MFSADSVFRRIDGLLEKAIYSIIDSQAIANWVDDKGAEVDYVADARRDSKTNMHIATRSKGRRDGGGDLESEAAQRLFWVLFRAQR